MECKREKIATINKHINISYETNSCWGGQLCCRANKLGSLVALQAKSKDMEKMVQLIINIILKKNLQVYA